MNPYLLGTLAFLGAALTVAWLYSLALDLFLRDRTRLSRRLEDEFTPRSGTAARKTAPLFKNLEKLSREIAAEHPEDSGWQDRWRESIEQAGLRFSLIQLAAMCVAASLLLGVLGWLLGRSWMLAGALGVAGAAAPVLYVRYRRRRRLEQILAQLPDAFDLVARMIRAGQTSAQAFQGVADSFDPPIAEEFAYCYEQQNLGLAPEAALRNMARRVDLVEMKIFILAVLVQRQTGGNLAELIDNLASLVRERYRIRGKIRVLTAEGRMEAAVLLALPPVVFLLIFALNRSYADVLLEYPNVLWGMAAFMLVGVLWIRRILNFDF